MTKMTANNKTALPNQLIIGPYSPWPRQNITETCRATQFANTSGAICPGSFNAKAAKTLLRN